MKLISIIIFGISICVINLLYTNSHSIEFNQCLNNNINEEKKSIDNNSEILCDYQIANLEILCKIWGFLKYYHPNISNGKYNWDKELLCVLPKILDTKTIIERNALLVGWIDSFGDIRVSAKKQKSQSSIDSSKIIISPDHTWIFDTIQFSIDLINKLKLIKDCNLSLGHYYYSKDFVDKFKNEVSYDIIEFPDTMNIRLLALFRYWNIINYYYQFKNLLEEDWNIVLKEFIPIFFNANNFENYKNAVLQISTRIRDGHAILTNVKNANFNQIHYYAPYIVIFIDNQAVIEKQLTTNIEYSYDLLPGDVILKINNIDIENIINERLVYVPGSNLNSQLRFISFNLFNFPNDSINSIQCLRNNEVLDINLKCLKHKDIEFSSKSKNTETSIKLLNDSIVYFIPSYLSSEEKRYLKMMLVKHNNVIIDMRKCSPHHSIYNLVSKYFSVKKTRYSIGGYPNYDVPGEFHLKQTQYIGSRKKLFYEGKIIIIVNEEVMSTGEHLTMAFQSNPNAITIGSQTAGASSNIVSFSMPGNIRAVYTGLGTYYPDSSGTQIKGVRIDVFVKPSIEGIMQGRDELLEKAIEIFENNQFYIIKENGI